MDVASQKDNRGIFLDEVGVRGVKIPIRVLDKAEKRKYQYTIGTFNAFVSLPDNQRGTHMSRIVEVIYNNRENINAQGLQKLAKELVEQLGADNSRIQVSFPYFIDKYSPVSGLHNLMTYAAKFDMSYLTDAPFITSPCGAVWDFRLGVSVDVMTVCPCALEECKTGASHVQRGQVKIDVKPTEGAMIWLEELIDIAEDAGSSPVFERLKRSDEKHLVLHGFKNPRFVEDVVREAVARLAYLHIDGYNVSCENFESIHQHNAYARRHDNWK